MEMLNEIVKPFWLRTIDRIFSAPNSVSSLV